MKRIIGTFVLLALAAIAAHVVIAYFRGTPTNYHWLDTIVVSATSTAVLAFSRKHTKR